MDKTESRIQQDIVQWYHNTFCLRHHKPRNLIFSVPNEMGISIANAIKSKIPKALHSIVDFSIKIVINLFKAMGLRLGVSDLIVVQTGEILFVEVKTEIGKQSKEQKEFQEAVEQLGFQYYIVRSLKQFKTIINGSN